MNQTTCHLHQSPTNGGGRLRLLNAIELQE
jgi:hypothetical protein